MKIGFDAKRAFFNNTGLGQYSRTLISDLEKYLPQNEYYLFSPKAPKTENNFSSKIIYPENKRLFWRSFGIKKQIIEQKLDIYHGLSNEIPFVSKSKMPCKFVVTIHDLIALKHPEWYPYFDARIYRSKIKFACKNADKIVAISEKTKQDILETGLAPESRIQVIYQSISELYRNPISQNESYSGIPYLLYVGSFSERKNVLFLLRVFAALKSKIPHHLYLIGNGNSTYEKKMMSLSTKLGLEKRIKVLKQISNEDLPYYYQNADLMLYPSKYEGFGLPVTESLACGTPIVSTQKTSMEEAGREGGIFLPLDENTWAEQIEQLLSNKENINALSNAGKKYVNRFLPEEIIPQWKTLFESL